MNHMLDRVRRAAERVFRVSVKVISQEEWRANLRKTGEATRLDQPLTPYESVLGRAPIETMVASGAPFTPNPGFHIVRRDEDDAPNIFNTDSYEVIENLTDRPQWPSIIKTSGL